MLAKEKSKASLKELSDQELVDWILKHGTSHDLRLGQEELYRRYSGKIYHKCISLIKDKEVAKDLTHDIFIKIFLHLSRYKSEAQFYSWVFAITYNYCFDYLKKQRKTRTEEITDTSATIADDELAMQYHLFKEAKLVAMERAFNHIKPAQRTLLSMYYQEKMSIKTIAELLGISDSAVKMRLKRSREHLAELIKQTRDGEEG